MKLRIPMGKNEEHAKWVLVEILNSESQTSIFISHILLNTNGFNVLIQRKRK